MARKTKKQSRKISSVSTSTPRELEPSVPQASSSLMNRAYSTEFNPDYSQTLKDLRRIGILAGSFFAILVIISLFLR